MKRLLALSVLTSAAIFGQDFRLGSKVEDFNIQDLTGKPVSFSSLKSDITVVTFVSVQCPVSNAYNDRMNALYKDYTPKGVKFIFLNANRTESDGDVAEHAKSVGFVFPVYKDPGNRVADRFGAQVTPESYVIDKLGTIQYHGSIDDSQNEARVKARGLRVALDSLLSEQPVPIAETKAFGCTIKRAKKST